MRNEELAGNRDTGLLKMIALVCMIIDHVGARILTSAIELRVIGRIAFPLYIWCMVVGACYTRCPWKYALRLLLVGLIAQPCYMLGLNHGWNQWSVFFTLFLGYLGIWAIRENKFGSRYWGPALVLTVPCFINMDYGWRGVLLILLMYLARERRGAIIAAFTGFCLFWGGSGGYITSFAGIPLQNGIFKLEMVHSLMRLQTLALLALPLILWPRARRTPFPKTLGYAVYPGHLVLLWVVQLILGVMSWEGSMKLLFP